MELFKEPLIRSRYSSDNHPTPKLCFLTIPLIRLVLLLGCSSPELIILLDLVGTSMQPSDEPLTEEAVHDYFTEERQEAWAILGSVKRTLSYRSFLVRHANNTYNEIKAGELDFEDDPNILQERNILRTLSAHIISETYNILEGLAAVSMNPGDPPEDRAYQLLTYGTHEVHDFYDSFDEETDLEYFQSILAYPSTDELGVDPSDEGYYQEVMDGSAAAYKDFYLVAKEARDLIQKSRHKFTHGFLLALIDRVRKQGGGRTYPEGCDDMLMTYIMDEDEAAVKGLLTGERPHEAHLTVARNAAAVQHDVIFQLMEQMRNLGEPVFPEVMFGGDHTPNREPGTFPSYSMVDMTTEITTEIDDNEVIRSQIEFFENVNELTERYGQPDTWAGD